MVCIHAAINPGQLPTGAPQELVTAPDFIASYAVYTGATVGFDGIFMTTRRYAKSAAQLVAGLAWLAWAGRESPGGDSLSFGYRQNKVSKEKATLLSASLRGATGSLRYSLQAGSEQTRLRLK